MRAAVIFGLGTSSKDLKPFRANSSTDWIERVPASSTDADAVLIDTDHNRGAMILTCDPRGYDSQNTGMPASLRNHDGRIALGIELGRDLFFRRGEDLFFNFLSLSILFVQKFGELTCFRFILGEQKPQ